MRFFLCTWYSLVLHYFGLFALGANSTGADGLHGPISLYERLSHLAMSVSVRYNLPCSGEVFCVPATIILRNMSQNCDYFLKE